MTATGAAEAAHYPLVAGAIRFLAEHRQRRPSLAELARQAGLSESHFQRVFCAWAGVSPVQFLQFLSREDALRRLRETSSVLDASLASGLSGSGRLHDLLLSWEGVTPGEYRQGGRGLVIRHGVTRSPFGNCFIAATPRGICTLAFFDDDEGAARLESELHDAWPAAMHARDDEAVAVLAARIFPASIAAAPPAAPLRLLLRGSAFQVKVWEALLRIPPGGLRSYRQIALDIGRPSAVRAVASAIARNNIGLLIPCHRVIRENGDFSHYRWGDARKQAMIAREAAMAGTA